jgi:hypothetical protein
MIFLDPFWDIASLRKRTKGFSQLLTLFYNTGALESLENTGEEEAESTLFHRHNHKAEQTLCNLVRCLGGRDDKKTVEEFLEAHPCSVAP